MLNRYKSFIVLFILLMCTTVSAQDQLTTLTTTGSGPSKEVAVQRALRSAIEQAFGAFISAKTEILNDELISDEITSVASGNVQNYELLSEVHNPEASSYFVTTKVTVSVSKLTAFVQSKGVEVEINGSLFAANIIQQELNAKSEYKAITNMFVHFHELMSRAYDYDINAAQPVLIDKSSNSWQIDLEVTAKRNNNFNYAKSLMTNTLNSLSLTEREARSYIDLGKEVYPVFLYNEDIRDYRYYEIAHNSAKYFNPNYLNNNSIRKGIFVSSIASELNVDVQDILNQLPSEAIKGKKGWERLAKEIELDLLVPQPEPFILLRNEKSFQLLKNIEIYLTKVYGQNFDVISNVNSYYSFSDLQVGLNPDKILANGHAIYVNGIQSKIIRPFFQTSYPLYHSSYSNQDIYYHENTVNTYETDRDNVDSYQSNVDAVYSDKDNKAGSVERFNKISQLAMKSIGKTASTSKYGRREIPMLRFLPERKFPLQDMISFTNLSELEGYKVKRSDNLFSVTSDGIMVGNSQTKLSIPILYPYETTFDCKNCDSSIKAEGQIGTIDQYFKIYEEYLWLFGTARIMTNNTLLEVVAIDREHSFAPLHFRTNGFAEIGYSPNGLVEKDLTRNIGISFERRTGYDFSKSRRYRELEYENSDLLLYTSLYVKVLKISE